MGMDSLVSQLGVGGIFALLVVRAVLDYLKARDAKDKPVNGNGNGVAKRLDAIEHEQRDAERLKPVVTELRAIRSQNSKFLERMLVLSTEVSETRKGVTRLENRINLGSLPKGEHSSCPLARGERVIKEAGEGEAESA